MTAVFLRVTMLNIDFPLYIFLHSLGHKINYVPLFRSVTWEFAVPLFWWALLKANLVLSPFPSMSNYVKAFFPI